MARAGPRFVTEALQPALKGQTLHSRCPSFHSCEEILNGCCDCPLSMAEEPRVGRLGRWASSQRSCSPAASRGCAEREGRESRSFREQSGAQIRAVITPEGAKVGPGASPLSLAPACSAPGSLNNGDSRPAGSGSRGDPVRCRKHSPLLRFSWLSLSFVHWGPGPATCTARCWECRQPQAGDRPERTVSAGN